MSQTPHTSPFEAIRHEDEQGNEYWSARELYKLLGYSRWEKFQFALEQAQKACENSGQAVADHFHLEVKMITAGKGAKRRTEDYHLSRYACYLIVQNADPSKPIVALGQTYFAVQTRRQELADKLAALPEGQKRLILRSEMSIFNTKLTEAAQLAGVIEPRDFAVFQDHGYMGRRLPRWKYLETRSHHLWHLLIAQAPENPGCTRTAIGPGASSHTHIQELA
jgi:DNA-damage-inducible protein D